MAAFFFIFYILVTRKISAITKKAHTPASPERGGGPALLVEGFKGGGTKNYPEYCKAVYDRKNCRLRSAFANKKFRIGGLIVP
ncbi:MAG: hypothetical protein ACI4JN_05240 [Ruminococcus sp.]